MKRNVASIFKFNAKQINVAYIIALILLAAIAHRQWLNPNNIFFHTDWQLWSHQEIKELWHSWGPWLSNNSLGSVNVQINFLGFYLPASWLVNLGLTTNFAVWLTFLLPILLLEFLAPYYFCKAVFKNIHIAAVCALFYGTVIYFLARQDSQLAMVIIFALAPLILLALYRAEQVNTARRWLEFSLLLWLASLYELRVTYIVVVACIIFFFAIKTKPLHTYVKNVLVSLTTFIGLSIFWLLPTIAGGLSSAIADLTNREIFGASLFDLYHAFTISDSSWTGLKPNESFISQPVKIYLWIIPLLAFSCLLFYQYANKKFKKLQIGFLLIALLGVFLTKETTAPLSGAYNYLYQNLPEFNLYREASKFYLLTAIGYLGLLAIFFRLYKSKHDTYYRSFYILAMLAVTIVSLLNLKPFLLNQFGGMLTARHIPASYVELNNKTNSDSQYYRIAWLPATSDWGNFDNLHPKINMIDLADQQLLNYPLSTSQTEFNYVKIKNFLQKDYAKNIVESLNIKYIVVPSRDQINDNDFLIYYGNNREDYLKLLNSLHWVKHVNIGQPDLDVYEVLQSKPYFTAEEGLTEYPNLNNIDKLYALQQTIDPTSQSGFINLQNKATTGYSTDNHQKLYDLTENLNVSNLKNSQLIITNNLNGQNANNLVIDTSQRNLTYQVKNSSLTIQPDDNSSGQMLNGVPLIINDSTTFHGQIALNPVQNFVFAQGDDLRLVNQQDTSVHTVNLTSDGLKLFSFASDSNLVKNGSFEEGLWQPKVSDCNHYNNGGILSMTRTRDLQTDGIYALALGATSHTACVTSSPIPVVAGQNYSLKYDYQLKNGQRAGYDLVFNDSKRTLLSNDQSQGPSRWFTMYEKFQVPSGATSVQVRLKGYPDDQNRHPAQTYYDNVAVEKLTLKSIVVPDSATQYASRPLAQTKVQLTANNSTGNYNNLLVNPSLEAGLWRKQVGDCNNYDDMPALGMSLNKVDKTDGRQSLELDATRHVACTGPPAVDVQEGESYLFSFDYKSPTESPAGYYISFNDPAGTIISGQLTITNKNWQNFTKAFVAPFGATHVTVSVYSYASQYGNIKEINLYDNFHLTQIPPIQDRYYVVSTPTQQLVQPKKITYQLASPSKKYVQITSASTPFYLVMSESYHPQWRLELDDTQANNGLAGWLPTAKPNAVPNAEHYNYDDFLNSWYVDPAALCKEKSTACTQNGDGSYNLKLIAEFKAQRYYYVGLVASGLTLIICLSYLSGNYVYRKRLNKKSALSMKVQA